MFADHPTSGDYAWSEAQGNRKEIEALRREVEELKRRLDEVAGFMKGMKGMFYHMGRP